MFEPGVGEGMRGVRAEGLAVVGNCEPVVEEGERSCEADSEVDGDVGLGIRGELWVFVSLGREGLEGKRVGRRCTHLYRGGRGLSVGLDWLENC